jgi:hypothetical protein
MRACTRNARKTRSHNRQYPDFTELTRTATRWPQHCLGCAFFLTGRQYGSEKSDYTLELAQLVAATLALNRAQIMQPVEEKRVARPLTQASASR